MFPVDPRDFAGPAYYNNAQQCTANIAATDSPVLGEGYLYSWSLGVPFLKSVVSAYYYGNISYPSVDAPKMGLLSTVPADASDKYIAAIQAAVAAGGNFPAISQPPPSGTPTGAVFTNSDGVAAAGPTSSGTTAPQGNDAPAFATHSLLLGALVIGSVIALLS